MYNHHGNQEYYKTGTVFRGVPLFESYNNTAVCIRVNCQFMAFRGGSVIVHDETFTMAGTPFAVVNLSEEECWQRAFFSPLRTAWPAQDQIMNSFFWNVTYNGSNITDVIIPTMVLVVLRSSRKTVITSCTRLHQAGGKNPSPARGMAGRQRPLPRAIPAA